MKSISRIQKCITVGAIAAVLGFGMLFISGAQPVHAQSPTQTALQEMINTLLAQIAALQTLLAEQQGGGQTPTVPPLPTTISVGETVQVVDGPLSIRATQAERCEESLNQTLMLLLSVVHRCSTATYGGS